MVSHSPTRTRGGSALTGWKRCGLGRAWGVPVTLPCFRPLCQASGGARESAAAGPGRRQALQGRAGGPAFLLPQPQGRAGVTVHQPPKVHLIGA